MGSGLAVTRPVNGLEGGGRRLATYNEKVIVSLAFAGTEVGLKVMPPAPTATTNVAARAREAARRAVKVARKSIWQVGRGVRGRGRADSVAQTTYERRVFIT
jgi:hypothetical protein